MTPLLRSSPPINSISHTLFRCRHSNSRDTVASSPFYSHHAARRRPGKLARRLDIYIMSFPLSLSICNTIFISTFFWDVFSCTLQIWINLGQHSFELLTFILFAIFQVLYLFVGFWQLVFAYLCHRVALYAGTAADFSSWGRTFPFFHKWFWVFVSGGVVLKFFRGFWFSLGVL